MSDAPSKEYDRALALSKKQHQVSKTYSGKFVRPYRGPIKSIIDRLACQSILDFGCGKGLQYTWTTDDGQTLEEYWGLPVTKYDPAYPPFAAEPIGTFDLVICTHVLAVIPVEDLDWFIRRLYGFANKAVYIVNGNGIASEKKAKWRVESVPKNWTAEQWVEILTRLKPKNLEVHMEYKPSGLLMTASSHIFPRD